MKRTNRMKTNLAIAVAAMVCAGALQAQATIDEPFDYALGNIKGTAALPTGLTGNWNSDTNNWIVSDNSLSYGALAKSANKITITSGNSELYVSPDPSWPTITDQLADGATLWFSVIFKTPVAGGSNPDTGFAFGDTQIVGTNNLAMGGQAIGFTIKQDKIQASIWGEVGDGSTAVNRAAGLAVATNVEQLIVGEIIWGATSGVDDTINIYRPAADLTMGAVTSTIGGQLTQANFDTISLAMKANTFAFDEIRFGASYADVTPVDTTPPTLVDTDPVDNEPDGLTIQQQAFFDEPVFVGAGDIRIVNDTDVVTTTIAVGDAQIDVTGTTLTITPTTPLLKGKAYHIEMDSGVVTDGAGVAYAGLSDPMEWNFIADDTLPTLVSFADDFGGGPIWEIHTVVYTVTFDEPMDAATINIADFDSLPSPPPVINSVTPTGDPAVFEVSVSPGGAGTLQLQIKAGATLEDLSGNLLDPGAASSDDSITVNARKHGLRRQ